LQHHFAAPGRPLDEPGGERVERQRMGNAEALSVRARTLAKPTQLTVVFYPFRNELESELLGDRNDGLGESISPRRSRNRR